jgi:hypothetical protein
MIKAYIYQRIFLYFGDQTWLYSHEITQKYQPSLSDALISVHVTIIYGRGGKGCVLIYIHIPPFVPLQQINM